ncbi:hypothetical protein JCM8202_000834 [Rhodotorula sphaerocarpa]
MAVTHPELLWAQRSSDSDPERNIIYLTISAAELDPDFTLQANGNRLTFHGKSRAVSSKGTAADLESKDFQFDYELFGEVEEVRRGLTGKGVQVVLRKKELSDEYWPRLTKEKGKNSRITTDWSKWVDEDEQDGELAADDDFGAGGMPPGMGGMGGAGGMPGMGGAGGMDLASMMGGAGGAGGAGGMDLASMMGGMGGAMGGAGGAGGMDFAKMMEQMKAAGVGAGGEGEDAPEGDSSDDDGPPPLEEA